MNEKLHLVLLIILGLILAALVSQQQALALMTLPFLFYLGAGLLTYPQIIQLRASRALTQIRGEANQPITMTVTIENDGAAIPRLHIVDPLSAKMSIVDGLAEQWVTLPAGGKAELRYTFRAPRGEYRWDALQVTASDPFGLFETQQDLLAAAQVRVLPGQVTLNKLLFQPRRTLQTPGPNLSRQPGSGIDFFGVREYHTGDSLRWIHWRLSARHPRLFFTKDFEREEMADIGLLLDGQSVTNLKYGTEQLFEYSVQAAAALAKWFLRSGNRVSLLALGERVVRVFPDSGKRQLVRIMDQLAGCEPGGKVSLDTLKYLPMRLFPSRSMIIIISPLRLWDFGALTRLRAEGYQVLLVSPNTVRFASQGSANPLAVRAAQLERTAQLWRIREMGVEVIDWAVDQPLMNTSQYMRRMRR